jgi:hypothetical protein
VTILTFSSLRQPTGRNLSSRYYVTDRAVNSQLIAAGAATFGIAKARGECGPHALPAWQLGQDHDLTMQQSRDTVALAHLSRSQVRANVDSLAPVCAR